MSDKSFRRPAESAEISEFRGNGRTIERECAPAPAGEDARYRAGFNAGVKAAAKWHMEAAAEWETADISDADRLKARYRELVKIAHPDRGGDPARFNEITDAIRRTREERA